MTIRWMFEIGPACCERGGDTLWRQNGKTWYCAVDDDWQHDLVNIAFCPFCGHDLSHPVYPSVDEALAAVLTGLEEPIDLVFDLDGVFCNAEGSYSAREPHAEAVSLLRKLSDSRLADGRRAFNVVVQTARYMKVCGGDQQWAVGTGYWETSWWLNQREVPHDALYLGKSSGHLYVDDRGCRVESAKGMTDWVRNFFPALHRIKQERAAKAAD